MDELEKARQKHQATIRANRHWGWKVAEVVIMYGALLAVVYAVGGIASAVLAAEPGPSDPWWESLTAWFRWPLIWWDSMWAGGVG